MFLARGTVLLQLEGQAVAAGLSCLARSLTHTCPFTSLSRHRFQSSITRPTIRQNAGRWLGIAKCTKFVRDDIVDAGHGHLFRQARRVRTGCRCRALD
jgi:hypothetical protein